MKKDKKLALVVAVTLLLMASVGISYAWFYQNAQMSTLINIIPPDSIKIIPIDSDGGDVSMLDLDFKEGIDKKTEDGTITILRPVYIYSTSPVHQLEVVHTTNLNELSFNIYPATKESDNSFNLIKENMLSGTYINQNDNDPKLAQKALLNNYKDEDIVEAHAYPLYWLAENSGDKRYVDAENYNQIKREVTSETETKYDPAKQVDKTYYKTYYYIEISWQEDSKETDLFYVMAQNIAVAEKNEGSVSTP